MLFRSGSCRLECGDGVAVTITSGTGGEDCDDGNDVIGDGCSFCRIEEGWMLSCTNTSQSRRVEIQSNRIEEKINSLLKY